jgi:transposase-like protein
MSKRREPENREKSELIRQLIREYKPQSVADIQAMLKDMFADVLQKSLEAEMDEELGYSKYDYRNKETDNTRNGYSGKTLKTSMGEVELRIPRDRNGDFEPQIIKKRQTTMPNDLEDRIISMYAKGMTTADIEAHMADVYGIEISDTMVSRITDKVLPIIREWQQRPLEEIYAVLFMDAIVYPVRKDGIIVKKAVYIAIGINLEGKKDVLGMWIGENESARFWAGILNELKNRGVKDILIACIDGLSGLRRPYRGYIRKPRYSSASSIRYATPQNTLHTRT